MGIPKRICDSLCDNLGFNVMSHAITIALVYPCCKIHLLPTTIS